MWNESNHRRYVGEKKNYDIIGAYQFMVLFQLGLREKHTLLDIGCGSLRAGRFFIQFLAAGHYYGIEPNNWLIREAIDKEIGRDSINLKYPFFSYNGNFDFSNFRKYDFDYILAHSIFSHASEKQIEKCINEICKVLKKNGIFIFTFCDGRPNNIKKDWTYPGKVKYTLSFMKNKLIKYGLKGYKLNYHSPGNQTWIKAERIKK